MPFTSAGFSRRTYAEWVEADEARAKEIFGNDIDTSENTPLGKYIRLNCEDKAAMDEDMEEIYQSISYKTASGDALRRHCANVGVTLSAGTRAQHTVLIHGTAGYEIEAGFEITTEDRTVTFYTVNNYTIGSPGTVTATVECTEIGEVGNVAAGTINSPLYNDANISDITDSAIVTVGEDADGTLLGREKYDAAKASFGSGTYNAVAGAVYQISGVQAVNIEENRTLQAVGDLPAKSFRVSVLAPENLAADIAQAIFSKMPFLSNTVGKVTETVKDQWGKSHEIHFSWMTEKLIYVSIKFLVDESWTAASETAAVEAVVEHINSLNANGTVYINDIYTALKGIPGKVNIDTLKIGTAAGSLGTSNITIGSTEVAKTNAACITIETESV